MVCQIDGSAVHGAGARRHGDVLQQDNAAVNAAGPIAIQLPDNGAVRFERRTVRRAWLLGRCLLLALCLGYYCVGDVRLQALAHFKDRPDLNGWAAKLRSGPGSGGGLCCSFADAEAVTDAQWDTKDGHYRVFLDGQWLVVDDAAVVVVPNLYGSAIVWPMRYPNNPGGKAYGIRCFLPGGGT